jgi:thiol:disulfide interchange protein
MGWDSTKMRGRLMILVLLAGIALLLANPLWMNLRPPDPLPAGFEAYSADAFRSAQQADQVILVDVYASWCPTCKAQQEVLSDLLEDPEFASTRAFRVDFDSDREFLRTHGVRSQSTLILFEGEREVSRSVGQTDERLIRQQVETALMGGRQGAARGAVDLGVEATDPVATGDEATDERRSG